MLVAHSRTCYQLDGILIKERHINILTSCSRGKSIITQKKAKGDTRADQAMCQHLKIWPPFVFRLLSSLSSTHLRNHVMIIRRKPIKKSNKREYIIIETPGPDDFQLCTTEKDKAIQLLFGVATFLWHVGNVWNCLVENSTMIYSLNINLMV